MVVENGDHEDIVQSEAILDFDSNPKSNKELIDFRVRRLKDERESVQKKTFTKWINSHLIRVNCKILDLYVDMRDGKMLLRLLQVLSGERLPKPTKGKMRIHCLENVDKALQFLRDQHVHLENLGSGDIVDGNPTLTLGLIWTVILRFQIQDITFEDADNQETRSAKEALLLWCQMKTAGYKNVNVRNFTTSWRDGLAFNALIHKHRPDLIDYDSLQKSNALHNLRNAFDVAESQLGLPKFLDPEDVNVEAPDDKSIITYVVTYYHYFNKMKQENIQSRRVGKILNEMMDNEALKEKYETMSTDLLEWIKETIRKLNNREFENSLQGVQKQLHEFNAYRTQEKPPKFQEKGDLEILLFSLLSRMRANNQRPFHPREGHSVAEINKSWEDLEKAEHARELALKEELIRQEKLEQLAARFDRKAGMRETWLGENQRLVNQENFGDDIGSVEAAKKKHEAIETDIYAYEERVLAVVAVADELRNEKYHGIERIDERKENVLRLWNQLLEALQLRRDHLNLSLGAERVFYDIENVKSQCDDVKRKLLSENLGDHLQEVDDLLQQHDLQESDLNIINDQIRNVNTQAEPFLKAEGPQGDGYKPTDSAKLQSSLDDLERRYQELRNLAAEKKKKLEDNKKLHQFIFDFNELLNNFRDQEQVLALTDIGRDITSVNRLLAQHRNAENNLESLGRALDDLDNQQKQLSAERVPGADQLADKIADARDYYDRLKKLAEARRRRLEGGVDYYQFFTDADEVDAKLVDTLRIISSDEVGRDESSTEALLRKHDGVNEELLHFEKQLESLQATIDQLPEEARAHPDVLERISQTQKRKRDVESLAQMRKQRLIDALSLYKMLSDADAVEKWIDEKGKLLDTLIPTNDLEEVEIMKHRFETLEKDMAGQQAKVDQVNYLARQLLDVDHPNGDEILQRQNTLNARWAQLKDMVDQKRAELERAHRLETFRIDCQETITWIEDKTRILEDSEDLTNDLSGVMKLQRRLSMMERDLTAIQAKLDALQTEAQEIEHEKPQQAEAIRQDIKRIHHVWDVLNKKVREHEAKLDEAGDLQRFLRDLDHFQAWLSATQRQVASEDEPQSMAEAEQLLQQHAAIREEIDGYEEDYNKMRAMGDRVTQDQTDPQYMFLRQRLAGLEEGWEELSRMWENRQHMLSQGMNLQMFLRDAKQAEVLLAQQENQLASERQPNSLEEAEQLLKRHKDLETTMKANDEKIYSVVLFGDQLCNDGHYAADKIHKKARNIDERRLANKEKADATRNRLEEALNLQKFLSDCEELREDLTTVNVAMQKQAMIESEMVKKVQQLEQLEHMEPQLEEMHPEELEDIKAHRLAVAEQLKKLKAPLDDRRKDLERKKQAFQFVRDVEDEKLYVNELLPIANAPQLGEDLADCNRLQKNNQRLMEEVNNHQGWINEIKRNGQQLIDEGHENAPEFQRKIHELDSEWDTLKRAIDDQKNRLDESELAHRYLYDCNEAEAWMSEQELYMMQDERGKDEFSTQNQIRKHEMLQQAIDRYADQIRELANRAQKFVNEKSPLSDKIILRQGQIEKLYAGLQDLAKDRRSRLDETLQLYNLHREIDDLLQWIADKEVVAGSHENGQDYEHVQMLQERFQQFARDTEAVGSERVAQANTACDDLIRIGHTDAPTIALWKDSLNEAWENLLELIDTRSQMLEASRRMHKFFHDCRDCLSRILEKTHGLPDELGRDSSTVGTLLRKHNNFLKDIDAIGAQVRQIEEDAAYLRDSYAGDKAVEIATRENEVLKAWRQLKAMCEARSGRLTDTNDLFKFLNMVRDLLLWMDEVKREMTSHERPRDVSGVELLMNNHQSLKAEIDTREENFAACITLGKNLLDARHYASNEIEKKLVKLTTERAEMMHRWEDRWEYLRLILEVYQFARDAAVADAWLSAQEPYLHSRNFGRNLEEVIALIKKHEAFEKSASAQEERFLALEKLTNFELKQMQRRGEHGGERRPVSPSRGVHAPGPSTTFPAGEPGRSGEEDLTFATSVTEGPSPSTLGTLLLFYSLWLCLNENEVDFTRANPRVGDSPSRDLRGTQVGDAFEGVLIRKHTYESLDRKASSRAWDKLYAVLQNGDLYFFKDAKHRNEGTTFKGEPPMQLPGCSIKIADYPKRRNVLSLRLPVGAEYLLQCNDEEDMHSWLQKLQLATGQVEHEHEPSPAPVSESQSGKSKKGGFFSRSKK
ncbi:hypothetical protein FO519_004581 [Halicephalobus sp. NKZ332]|nr:hypothetical protein FO519_004581 [Halicephalobus sp. NKZ332]